MKLELEKEVSDAVRLLRACGIEEIIIRATVELGYNTRPMLLVSYKQFDLLMKKNDGLAPDWVKQLEKDMEELNKHDNSSSRPPEDPAP